MDLLKITILVKIFITFGLGLVYLYLYVQYRERYMGLWTLSWALYSTRLALDLLRFSGYDAPFSLVVNQAATILSVLFLLMGIYNFAGKKTAKWWIYGCIAATLLSDLAVLFNYSNFVVALPTATYFGLAEIWTGIMFLRFRTVKGLGRHVTGYAFIILGVINLGYPFDSVIPSKLTVWAFLSASLFDFTIIIGTLLVYFQKIRQDLSESEKRFRLLAENAKDIVYRYVLHPKPGFEYVSPAVTAITGYTPEDFYSSPGLTFKIVHPQDRPRVDSFKQLPGPVDRPITLRLISKDGKTIWTEQQIVTVYGKNNRPEAVEGIVRDITERKQMEQEMIRLDQLRIIGEMAATIAHEIKTPLTTVQGYLQILLNKHDSSLNKDYLPIVLDELARANAIISEHLSLSREKQLQLQVQNLNDIILNLFPLIKANALASAKEAELETGDIKDLPLDENEIRQLLLNLVQNGLEAMPAGGKLNIRTFQEQNEVVLAVRDQGEGIEPEILKKIGTPFLTTKKEGTGLGLAVCYAIADRHRATISVETGPGGTTFYVRFKTN
jgi:PAS domain S-box-containing protein